MKILIVDDEFDIAKSYINILENENIISDFVTSYKNAIDVLKLNEYDIILLDINLIDGSGIDLIKYIKNIKINTGIIVITGNITSNYLTQSFEQGCDDFLLKPINDKELILRINALYRRLKLKGSDNLTFHNLELNISANLCLIDNIEIKLTNKEILVMEQLLLYSDGYISSDKLKNNINDLYDVSDASLRVHIFNLKNKLIKYNFNIINKKGVGYRICQENSKIE